MRSQKLAFNGGELSPWLSPRLDLAKFHSGCEKLENCQIVRYGGARSRAGLAYIDETKDSAQACRLEGFAFSRTKSFILEWGNNYVRFYDAQSAARVQTTGTAWADATAYTLGQVVETTAGGDWYVCILAHTSANGGTTGSDDGAGDNEPGVGTDAATYWEQLPEDGAEAIYELTTPYGAAEVADLQFAQRNDVIVVVHPNHEPRILTYYDSDEWRLELAPWKTRPFEDENGTQTTLTASATTGTGQTLTASAALFDATWVGSFIKMVHTASEQQFLTSIDRVSDPQDYSSSFGSADQINASNLGTTSYDVADAGTGNPNRIRYDGFTGTLKPVFTTIADYDHTTDFTGNVNPFNYPSFFKPGIVALGPYQVDGEWEFETTDTWRGEWKVQRSYDSGTTWLDVKTCRSDNDKNFLVQDEETADGGALYRVVLTYMVSDENDAVYFRILANDVEGVVEVTAVASSISATVDVTSDLDSTDPTSRWCENSFSDRLGYPKSVTWHEERLWFAGTAANPQKLWGSQTSDYFDFIYGSLATSALALTLNANRFHGIEWVLSHRELLIGTTGGVWAMTTFEGAPISPENVRILLHSADGTEGLPAIVANNAAIYVQRQGRKVRELSGLASEFGGYDSIDLTQLAEHVTKGGVLQFTVRNSPDTSVEAITDDGILIGMIYERNEQIAAWHRWTTDGTFESVATTYGAGEEDELWVVVNRTVDGITKRYVERHVPDMLRAEEAEDQTAYVYMDSAITVTKADATTTVSGLDHLEGKTVQVMVDGYRHPDRTISAGAITLTDDHESGSKSVTVGLPYTATVRPMPFALSEKVTVSSCWGRFRHTSNAQASLSEAVGTWRDFDFTQAASTGSPRDAYTADAKCNVSGQWKRGQSISIRQTEPLPMVLLAIMNETQGGRD